MSVLQPDAPNPVTSSASADTYDFNAVYTETASFVWTNARRLGVPLSQVDDVVQDVFVVVHRRLAEFDGRANVKTWVCSILMNVVREYRRRFRRKDSHDVELGDSHLDSHLDSRVAEQLDAVQALQLVQRVLDRMSDEKAELIVLLQLEGMSVPEVALATGLNENTLYARMRAARREFDSIESHANPVDARSAAAREEPFNAPASSAPPTSTSIKERLAQELPAIHHAEDQLRAGDARGALISLDEYAQRHPGGLLRQEHDALQILARCQLGQNTRERIEAFERNYPRSLSLPRIHGACPQPR